jgi:hypothetical protein
MMIYFACVPNAFGIIGGCGCCAGSRSSPASVRNHHNEKFVMIQGKFSNHKLGATVFNGKI